MEFDVTVDEVDSILEERLIHGANYILDNVLSELSSRESDANCYENETNVAEELGETRELPDRNLAPSP